MDYFCNLVDEVTEEKDEYKRKFEEEKVILFQAKGINKSSKIYSITTEPHRTKTNAYKEL